MRPDHDIVSFADYRGGPRAVPAAQAVLQLFGDLFPTITSAKRACRKGVILVDGERVTTDR